MAGAFDQSPKGPLQARLRTLWTAWFRPDRDESDRRAVAASGLLDQSFYLIQAPDVHEAKLDPVFHFCAYGWREGRRPNLYFDPAWYREVYLAARPDANPLAHYIRKGEAAGHRPIAYFDPAWYRKAYRLERGASPLRHFLENRRSQRFAPNPQFDLAYYLGRHIQDIGPNRDPFTHLIRFGAMRDLDPSTSFDSAAYRARSMRVPNGAASGVAAHELRIPLIHYLDGLARSSAKRTGRP